MKKNICRIFVIVAVIFVCSIEKAYAAEVIPSIEISLKKATQTEIMEALKESFGYKGDVNDSPTEIRLDTKITYKGRDGNGHKIQIGENEYAIEVDRLTKNTLKDIYGYDIDNPSDTYGYDAQTQSWPAVLVARTERRGRLNARGSTANPNIWYVYAGSEYITAPKEEELDTSHQTTVGTVVEGIENAVGTAKAIWNFANEFKEDPSGTLLNWITDLIRSIGDSIQTLANSFQTFEDGKDEITYSEDFLKSNEERKDYVNIGEYKAGKKSRSYQKYIDVNPGENEEGEEMTEFSKSTEIPVIPVDIYTIAIGDIDVLDVNFLVPNKKAHSENSWWMKLRNISTTVIHLAIYVAAAFLLTSLIWNGLHLVRGSLSPEKRKEHVNALNRFATSLVMLVGTVIIMAIGIYANEMFLPKAKGENASQIEYPIRVNVKDAEYSFSTNITGYVRYMAQIENKKLAEKRFSYTGVYLILAFVNLMSVLAMLVRLVCMMVLAMIGPIIVVLHVLNIENSFKLTYKDWAKWYLKMAALQVILALICRLMLDVAITVVE